MSETIIVEFSGDCWNRPTHFVQQLNQIPLGESVVLDMRSEGPSLDSLGVCDVINNWLSQRQQSPDSVQLLRWSNPVEPVPYKRVNCSNPSHFFSMSRNYWVDTTPNIEQQLSYNNFFGLFIGRITFARAVILYHCINKHVFVSKMTTKNPYPWQFNPHEEKNLEQLSDWLTTTEQYQMFNWYDQYSITSVDQQSVQDQFTTPNSYIDTNRSLLNHYGRFAVEIVCETYTTGNTFFPTEKTIRPIMACKPMLVYGPQYFLARLRTMGFQTYNNLWDESYDLYQGSERWQRIQKIINALSNQSKEDQQQLLTQAHAIALHNRQRLHDIVNHKVNLFKHDYKNI
jgi:hypothetical protein